MKIKSFGCSFIYGSDLSDCPHGVGVDHPPPSKLTWPSLLSKTWDLEYSCFAWPGIGNLRILERILHESVDPDPSFYIISWTWLDRLDYVDNHQYPWAPWAWRSILPTDDSDFAEQYFRDYHSQVKDQLNSLIYVNQAIHLLKSKSIPFVMTYLDKLLLENTYHNHPGMKNLQESVAPYLTDFNGLSFLDWSKNLKFAISDNWHPLEQAHQAAANYMQPLVTDLLTQYNTKLDNSL
jgi:hypothetical protein